MAHNTAVWVNGLAGSLQKNIRGFDSRFRLVSRTYRRGWHFDGEEWGWTNKGRDWSCGNSRCCGGEASRIQRRQERKELKRRLGTNPDEQYYIPDKSNRYW